MQESWLPGICRRRSDSYKVRTRRTRIQTLKSSNDFWLRSVAAVEICRFRYVQQFAPHSLREATVLNQAIAEFGAQWSGPPSWRRRSETNRNQSCLNVGGPMNLIDKLRLFGTRACYCYGCYTCYGFRTIPCRCSNCSNRSSSRSSPRPRCGGIVRSGGRCWPDLHRAVAAVSRGEAITAQT